MRGFVVEMSVIVPIILGIILSSIFAAFYYHDKIIISGAAYEAVAVGAGEFRKKGNPDEAYVEKIFRERLGQKCIFFSHTDASVEATDEMVNILVTARGRRMVVSVQKSMALTAPEDKVRDLYRIREVADGADNLYKK